MKKILFLLLSTIAMYGQVPSDATPLENVQITNNVQDNSATKVTVQNNQGVQNWQNMTDLPLSNPTKDYVDSRPITTAGQTNRIYFTGDVITLSATNYYQSSLIGKGTSTGVLQTVMNDDNEKKFFTQDIISIAQPSTTIAPAGNYAGSLSVSVSSDAAQERFTIEVYKTNNSGTPIASGITGAPVGNLGITVIAILDSGIIDLVANSVTNINVSGNLASPLTLNTGERVRYHVSAQKVGTSGNVFTFSVFYGSNYNSYYDSPVATTTDGVINKSTVTGTTTTNALDWLNTNTLKKTGEVLSNSIDFDPLLSQDPINLTIKKRIIEPESTRLPIAYTSIYCWGDSMTQGAGGVTPWTTMIAGLTKFDFVNKGIGGETSTQIKDRFIAEPLNYDKTVIIWAGRNNATDIATVKADIATMVSALTHARYLVFGVTNGAGEGVGTSVYNSIVTLNSDLKTIYGEKFVDIRKHLVSLHNQSAQDLSDFANDIVPTSLRIDGIHLNFTGNTAVSTYLNARLGVAFGFNGYFQSKDFKYYLDTYFSPYTSNAAFTNPATFSNSITVPNKNIYTSFGRNASGADIVKQMTHFWNGTSMQAISNTPIHIGVDAGKNSTAGSVGLIAGTRAGENNVAPFLGAVIGTDAGQNLKGSHYGGIFGAATAQNQDGNDVGIISGTNAAQYGKIINTGSVSGTNAAQYGIFTNVGGVQGYAAASRAVLSNVGIVSGADSGSFSVTSNTGGIIGNSGTYNEGSNNIFGYLSHVSFNTNSAGAKNIGNNATDINTTTNRITITAHGFGATNSYTNLRYSTTGTVIGGLTNNNIYQVQVIDANTIQVRVNILTSIGTGVHTFTPQFKYTGVNILGNGLAPTKSNQTVISGGELILPQSTVATIDDDITNKALISKEWFSSKTATFANNSDVVKLTGAQTIADVKTFSSSPIVPTATTSGQAVNKGQLDLKADNASPSFTGTPTAPTAAPGTNTGQVSTTAFGFTNFAPISGSSNYIQNQNISAQTGNIWISGGIRAGSYNGNFSLNVNNGVTSPFEYYGGTTSLLFSVSNAGKGFFESTVVAKPATVDTELATWAQAKAIRPYKVYSALVNQTGTSAPTVTVLENTLSGTPVFTYVTAGFYFVTLTGAFPAAKTHLSITPSSPTASYSFFRNTDDVLVIRTQDNGTMPFTDADAKLFNNSIEIRVYNFIFLLLPYSMIRRRKRKINKLK